MISKFLHDFDIYFANYIDILFKIDRHNNTEFIPIDESDGIFISRILENIVNVMHLQMYDDIEELFIESSDAVDEIEVLGGVGGYSAPEFDAMIDICTQFLSAINEWYKKNDKENVRLSHLEYMELLPEYKRLVISKFKKKIITDKAQLSVNVDERLELVADTKNNSSNNLKIFESLKYSFSSIPKLKWKNIRIELLSDSVIRFKIIDSDVKSLKFNYTDLGMRDKRKTDMPNRLWTMLTGLIEIGGNMPYSLFLAEKRYNRQKTISDLRNKLKEITGIKENPIIFNKSNGYTVQFKVKDSRPRSYHSDLD